MQIECHNPIDPNDPKAVENAFEGLLPQRIACCNWAEQYPYAPRVGFRMFHTGDLLWLRFDVAEEYTKAEVAEDNGRVWTDSCVEFFFAPDDTGYYNFEATCAGRLLLAFRKEREYPTHTEAEVLGTIRRYPSLGTDNFAERTGNNRWSLTLAIPPGALFRHRPASWNGLEGSMNLYKCGDELSHPHFLSWRPIDNPKPDFHLPRFFENVKFK